MSHDHDHESCGCGCGGHVSPGLAGRDWAAAGDQEVVCPCQGLTKQAILAAIEAGAFTLPLLKIMTGAGRQRDCALKQAQGRNCEADLAALLHLYAHKPHDWPQGCH